MASTVPGVERESIAAKLGLGAQAPDLSSLAAPTISLAPTASGRKLGQLRRSGKADRAGDASPISGDSFASTLAKAIAARKAATDQASRSGRPARVEARQEREAAVRDVVRQLKQLVDTARDAARETKVSTGTPRAQSAQAIAHRDPVVDAETLRGVFERLSGADTDAANAAANGEDASPSPQAEADVKALLHTVAETIAQAMTPDGEIDEAALAATLLADPLAMAAAESLIAALQVQLVVAVPVALLAIDAEGDSAAGADVTGSASQTVGSAQPEVTRASATSTASLGGATTQAETVALTAPAATTAAVLAGETAASAGASSELSTARAVLEAEAIPAAVTLTTADATGSAPAAQPALAPVATESAATVVAAGSDGAVAAVEAVQQAQIAATANTVAETASLAGVAGALDEAVVMETADAVVVSSAGGSDETSVPTSVVAEEIVSTQGATGQPGAQAQTDDRSSEGEGGDAVSIGATSARGASAGQSSSQAATTADTDGGVMSGQATQNAPGAQSVSANNGTTSTGTSSVAAQTSSGSTAAAAQSEAVTQTQMDMTPDVELHEQISPVIVRQARLMNVDGGQELTMRLNPDHLGPLHVRISLLEGALSVGLTTASAEAQRALENALPQLRGALIESGLRLERLDVSQRDAGSGGNGQPGSQRGSANAGRGGGQPGYQGDGADGRQAGTGTENGGASFADVLLDQDGRAFGTANRGARWMGYRAYRRG